MANPISVDVSSQALGGRGAGRGGAQEDGAPCCGESALGSLPVSFYHRCDGQKIGV